MADFGKGLTQVGNIMKGADAATGANRARATGNAARRAEDMGNAMFDAAAPILMQPDVLAALPSDLAARIKLGDPAAVLEGMSYVARSGKIPRSIPSDRQLARNNFPGPESGFQMGMYGGRVPTDSAGELIPAGSREVLRYPGAEEGFQMGGGVPPQQFDPMGLSVPPPGSIAVRQTPRGGRQGSSWPLVGGAIGAAAGGKLLYDALQGDEVQVQPEEATPETSENDSLPPVDQQMQEVQAQAAAVVDQMMGRTQSRRKPPRPEGELFATQGERSMEYELRPGTPQARTRDVLLDAGVEPERAEGIARGIVSMTEMERRAVIENGPARAQRASSEMQDRRRMRGY